LTGIDVATIQQNREDLAADFAQDNRVVLVLKGHQTVVTDGQRLAVNPTGNSGMATGGSGDVLTGLIAALLGQGLPAFEAAQLGAYLHGLAGDLAAAELSKPGLIASDLPRYLAMAWQQLES
jgi:NAD(P)H-hydrate epimerase